MVKKYVLKETSASMSFGVDYERELNPSQWDVVQHADGPSLVLAGAGSGKTRTLVYRVLYLLERNIPPESILFVTFTNKAAHEMRNRIEHLCGSELNRLWCGTFHHVALRILKMHAKTAGLSQLFGILDEEDARDLVRSSYEALPPGTLDAGFPKANVAHRILSYAVNVQKDIADVLDKQYPYFSRFAGDFSALAREYARRKEVSQNLDYDDLLTHLIRLLDTVPEVRRELTEQFRYCLVDEYQDTNALQHRVIRILAEKHRNVLVVGDDAQSIYSFRGADIHNILSFPKDYADARIFKLETNYRSTPPILHLANESIRFNSRQFQKVLKSSREGGALPQWVRTRDLGEQAEFVAQRVTEFVEEGLDLSDIAVLFRARYQAAEVELALSKRRIPYVLRGGVRFFEQAHIKDVMSFLRILENPQDELAWTRVLRQHQGIGMGYAARIYQGLMKDGGTLEVFTQADFGRNLPSRARQSLQRVKSLLRMLMDSASDDKPDQMISLILENGYADYVRAHFENAPDRLEDLKELVNFAHTYKGLHAFLADIALRENFKGETLEGKSEKGMQHLVLSTIHQAKGLEWKAVIVIALSEGHFPRGGEEEDSDELEEERRLFYVAVTRAKDELILVHPMTYYQYNVGTVISRPSLFLAELPADCTEALEIERREASDDGDANFMDDVISLDDK